MVSFTYATKDCCSVTTSVKNSICHSLRNLLVVELTLPPYPSPAVELVSDVLEALKGRVNHSKKTLSSRGDHLQASGSRGCPRSGKVTAEVCKQLGVAEQSYYLWRREYGGLKVDQAKKLKEPEKENAQLKRLVTEAELDKAILKEATSENF